MEGEGGREREGEGEKKREWGMEPRTAYSGSIHSPLSESSCWSALSYLEGEVGRRGRGRRERGREVGRRERERGRKVRMRAWGGEKREKDGERGREVILLIKEVCEGQ